MLFCFLSVVVQSGRILPIYTSWYAAEVRYQFPAVSREKHVQSPHYLLPHTLHWRDAILFAEMSTVNCNSANNVHSNFKLSKLFCHSLHETAFHQKQGATYKQQVTKGGFHNTKWKITGQHYKLYVNNNNNCSSIKDGINSVSWLSLDK